MRHTMVLMAFFASACAPLGPKGGVRAAHPEAGNPADRPLFDQNACEAATRPWPSLPDLDRTIEAKMASGHLPGLGACIVKDGDLVWCGAYGSKDETGTRPVTTDTPFIWASVSKLVTATAIGMLAEQGRIDLDASVDQHLDYSIRHPNAPHQTITTRAVLAHVGGLDDNYDVIETYIERDRDPTRSLGSVVENYFSPAGDDYDPDWNFVPAGPLERNVYSNMGYALLGHQVEAATGGDFADWTVSNIFEPLGMYNSGWYLADFNRADLAEPIAWKDGESVPKGHYTFADYPNGGLRSSVHDMGCFLAMASRGGNLYGVEVLPSERLIDMMQPAYPAIDRSQGLGWYYENQGERDPWIGHSGGEVGVASDLFMRQDGSVGFVVVANGPWKDERAMLAIEAAIIDAADAL